MSWWVNGRRPGTCDADNPLCRSSSWAVMRKKLETSSAQCSLMFLDQRAPLMPWWAQIGRNSFMHITKIQLASVCFMWSDTKPELYRFVLVCSLSISDLHLWVKVLLGRAKRVRVIWPQRQTSTGFTWQAGKAELANSGQTIPGDRGKSCWHLFGNSRS